jgi:hypothetical protein
VPHPAWRAASALTLAGVALAGAALVGAAQPAPPPPDGPRPPARAHQAIGYSDSLALVIVHGGSTPRPGGHTFFDDVWGWDGTRWRSLGSTGRGVSGHRLVTDARGRLLSVGGYDGRAPLADVRHVTGPNWPLLSHDMMPARAEPAVAYDTRRRRVVLHGGLKPGGVSGETWEFDGARWTRVATSGPGPLHSAAMAYDEARGVTLLVGGMDEAGAASARTWAWDGATWRELAGAAPPARFASGMAYDARRGRVLLYGGLSAAGPLGDTWLWDGRAWRAVANPGPPPRMMSYLAYDRRRGVIVQFGGRFGPRQDSDETWEWDGARWQRATPRP